MDPELSKWIDVWAKAQGKIGKKKFVDKPMGKTPPQGGESHRAQEEPSEQPNSGQSESQLLKEG